MLIRKTILILANVTTFVTGNVLITTLIFDRNRLSLLSAELSRAVPDAFAGGGGGCHD